MHYAHPLLYDSKGQLQTWIFLSSRTFHFKGSFFLFSMFSDSRLSQYQVWLFYFLQSKVPWAMAIAHIHLELLI